jgi:hypothetical protein
VTARAPAASVFYFLFPTFEFEVPSDFFIHPSSFCLFLRLACRAALLANPFGVALAKADAMNADKSFAVRLDNIATLFQLRDLTV